jgi:hypothetical protein
MTPDLRSHAGRSSEDRRKMRAKRILFIRARPGVQPARILLDMRAANLYSPKTNNCDALRFIRRTLNETTP